MCLIAPHCPLPVAFKYYMLPSALHWFCCLSLSSLLLFSHPHTYADKHGFLPNQSQLCSCMSIVWWSTKNNSSQKKTAARDARFCLSLLFIFYPITPLGSFFLCHWLCYKLVLWLQRQKIFSGQCCSSNMGRKRTNLAVASLCSLECLGLTISHPLCLNSVK